MFSGISLYLNELNQLIRICLYMVTNALNPPYKNSKANCIATLLLLNIVVYENKYLT